MEILVFLAAAVGIAIIAAVVTVVVAVTSVTAAVVDEDAED